MTCEDMIYSDDYTDRIISFYGKGSEDDGLMGEGCRNEILPRISICHSKRDSEYLTDLESIPYAAIPKLFGLMDSSNMEESGVKQVQSPSYLGLDGSGVMVGIIDTGIMYDNKLFRDENGRSRIGVIWDQTIRGGNGAQDVPKPYYGTAYSNEQINASLQTYSPYSAVPPRDDNGHGTFLAGIAAGGADKENDFTGIATGAELAVVKLKEAKPYLRDYFQIRRDVPAYSETDILYAVDYLLKYARLRQKALSILIGVGSSNGGHEGLTYLERYLNTILQNVGIMVSAPAGNEGAARLHYYGELSKTAGVEEVEINVDEGQEGLSFEFWGEAPTTFGIGLVSPRGDRIEQIPPRFGKEELISLPLSGTTVYVAYQIAEAYSGNELIFVRLIRPTPGIWRILVYADAGRQRQFNIWMPLRQFLQANTHFLRSNPEDTITVPGNEQLVMTMTAYNHLNGSIYAEAGRGYNARSQIKPNLAAPGVNITGPGLRNNYVIRSGTSVAAAHSAGMIAQFFQWELNNYRSDMLFAGQIQSIFQKSAVRDPEMEYPNAVWGYGIMNVERAFERFRVTG